MTGQFFSLGFVGDFPGTIGCFACNCDICLQALDANVSNGGDSMKVGYRRVSTIDQNLDRQDLGAVDRVFEEKVSGKNTDRAALQEMIAFVREGDEVIIYSIDRLARDLRDLQAIIQTLLDKNVSVTFLSERLSFSSDKEDAFSVLQLQMMGAFAQLERALIARRVREGIAKAKERGVYKGRKKQVDDAKIVSLKNAGQKISEIAAALGVSRMTVYRALGSAA
jgi:DNA invertase Pin-like site-specific DNA recombinase